MAKKLFVTGTGTDIGKTYVTGLLLKKMREFKFSAAYYKAAMSGNEWDQYGNLIPGDALQVQQMSGISQPTDSMCPYVYAHAYSPHLASRLEGHPVSLSGVLAGYHALENSYDFITLEGSGGILCPLNVDETPLQLEDVIQALHCPCLIIADAGLGTINQVVLTVFYMKAKNIPIKGIFLNHWHGGILEEDNLRMCERMTGLPVLACIADHADTLDLDQKTLLSLYE